MSSSNSTRAPQEKILVFIHAFTFVNGQERREVIDVFTHGCCFWFAEILCMRFGGELVYDYTIGHFGCAINGCVYDVTGDVTHQYKWTPWCAPYDQLVKQRVVDGSVLIV